MDMSGDDERLSVRMDVALGVGCDRGVSFETVEAALAEALILADPVRVA
jgi:cobalamin biosynthesis protein CbiG